MPSKARVEQVRNKDKIIRIDKHWEYMWIVAVISSEYYQKLFCMMEIAHWFVQRCTVI